MPHTSANSRGHNGINGARASFDVAAHNAPVTYSRAQAVNADDKLEKPGIARSNAAVSSDKPNGEPEHVKKYQDYVRSPLLLDPTRALRVASLTLTLCWF